MKHVLAIAALLVLGVLLGIARETAVSGSFVQNLFITVCALFLFLISFLLGSWIWKRLTKGGR